MAVLAGGPFVQRGARHSLEQGPAVGVPWPGEKCRSIGRLLHPAVAQDEDMVGDHLGYSKVVGHKYATEPDLLLEIL